LHPPSLAGRGGEDGPSLVVTVVLPAAPGKELEYLRAHEAGV